MRIVIEFKDVPGDQLPQLLAPLLEAAHALNLDTQMGEHVVIAQPIPPVAHRSQLRLFVHDGNWRYGELRPA